MTMSEKDRQVLRALTKAREQYEGLAELLDFYYDLYEVQFQAKAEMSEPRVRDGLATHWRLDNGIPQLTFDQLGLEPEPFGQLVAQVTDVLVAHNPTWAVERKEQTGEALVALAQESFEGWDTPTPYAPNLREGESERSWPAHPGDLAVEFALAPYLQRAAEVILPRLSLDLWVCGRCPVCGGRPNFALLDKERGARQLLCARCDSMWAYSRVGCPFCKSTDKQTYYLSQDGVYRLYICPACKRYLKTMDMREVQREICPAVERLLTAGMDLAARQEGYEG
jgi:Protein involved in formate dehydrogenase formation